MSRDARSRRRPRRSAILVGLMLALAAPTLTACVPPPVLDEFRHAAENFLHRNDPTSPPTAAPNAQPTPAPTSGAFVGNTSFADLKIGDCVDDLKALDYSIIEGLDVVPCASPHDSEIYAIPSLVGPSPYPGDDAVRKIADDACYAAFTDYVGIRFEDSALDYDFYSPSKGGWNDNERDATCVVFHDDRQTTGSVKGTAEVGGTQTS